jgi:hypothetical protein
MLRRIINGKTITGDATWLEECINFNVSNELILNMKSIQSVLSWNQGFEERDDYCHRTADELFPVLRDMILPEALRKKKAEQGEI